MTFRPTGVFRAAVFIMVVLSPRPAHPCDMVRMGPSQTAEDYVRAAQTIVRAKARAYASIPSGPSFDDQGQPTPTILFDVIEVLKGERVGKEVTLPGFLMERDDFNTDPVPYTRARPASIGPCYADFYRAEREFLLFLIRRPTGELTVRWSALAPLNEQLRGDDDPWLLWVRKHLR